MKPLPMSHANSAAKISVPSIVDLVATELRKLVLSGSLKPGERLIEERLTEQFGISRPPLREAMRLLQHEGLIVRLPRRGSVVTPLTADDVREIYSLRSAYERLAIEQGVPVADPARLQPMRAALEGMRRAAALHDREALLEENLCFHQALCGLPGNGRLLQAYLSLMMQLQLCMAMNIRFREQMYGNLDENVERHQKLLDLIEAGEQSQVLAALAQHGERSFMERLDELIESEQQE